MDECTIISEDFDLTPAIREGILERVGFVNDHLRENCPISVYLSKSSSQLFTVRMNMRTKRKDFTSSGTDRDFYVALNQAKDHLVRQIDDRRKKRISMRHRARGEGRSVEWQKQQA
ncbi:MAG: HPF/RaiA family ribosome-associated protein [Bdellovibrionales bacterium]|nr:HPF/RaiA family ribosome-associated protein [Bdellovibrionales bacterium]